VTVGSSRREFLATGAGAVVAVTVAAGRVDADWQPSARYPDPAIKILDPSFLKYRVNSAKVERLGTGYRWSEGPVWFGDGRYLLWSDIPNNRILKWEEETGAISVFRKPSNNSNGNTRDRQGRLLTCEHDARRVTRTEYDGTVTVIAERFEGKPLNSPNDIVCKSDGSIWFSDPPFGVLGFYEGHRATPELATNVYRVDPGNGRLAVVASDVNRPNGLAFSPDESILYVVEAGTAPRSILAFDVVGGSKLARRRTLIDAGPGTPDGLRVDTDGNLWIGWGWARKASTAWPSSTPTASSSAASTCPSAARTSASEGSCGTACSWPRARPCIRSS
jgi:gluconolactonase